MNSISDEQWFAANLNPGNNSTGILLPGLPSEAVQLRFTGAHGKANLQQAFDFYKFVCQHMPRQNVGRLRLIDFGGGWGRVTRFFLRDIPEDQLVLVDCLTDAVECAKSLNPPFEVIHSDVNPPLPFSKSVTDCCIAFSVFSHLSEAACLDWLSHLGELLTPGGKLVFTTRGPAHIESIRSIRLREKKAQRWSIRNLLQKKQKLAPHNLVTKLPHPDQIEHLYKESQFQFYPTGGGGELQESFYGETWIPEKWIAERYTSLGFEKYQFFPEFASVNQCVFVLTK